MNKKVLAKKGNGEEFWVVYSENEIQLGDRIIKHDNSESLDPYNGVMQFLMDRKSVSKIGDLESREFRLAYYRKVDSSVATCEKDKLLLLLEICNADVPKQKRTAFMVTETVLEYTKTVGLHKGESRSIVWGPNGMTVDGNSFKHITDNEDPIYEQLLDELMFELRRGSFFMHNEEVNMVDIEDEFDEEQGQSKHNILGSILFNIGTHREVPKTYR